MLLKIEITHCVQISGHIDSDAVFCVRAGECIHLEPLEAFIKKEYPGFLQGGQ